jgi:4-amino-4-deoxy-L-arabinose transferase-like glycosyltransferase
VTAESRAGARWLALALLLVLAVALFAPGQSGIPPIDRDESRYAVATTQMLTTGDFIDIRFQDEARHLQPAGIYWMQSIAVSVFSSVEARAIWGFRLVSLAGATLAVLLTGWLAARLFGAGAGLIAGALLGVSLLLGVEARMAKIDATMLAAVLTAQSALMLLYLDRARRPALAAGVFWAALGVGLMLKGPVGPLVSGLTILVLIAWDRRIAWLRRLHARWGIPLMLAIVLPWLIAITVSTGGAFLTDAVGHSMLGKVATGQQAHGAPPGYHLLAFNIAFWPGSLFAVLAIPFIWRNRREPAFRFLIAWMLPTWLVFELVATKLPHYTLPTHPAIATLAAAALTAGAIRLPEGRWRWPALGYLGLWKLVGAGLALAGTGAALYLDGRLDPVAIAVSVLGLAAIGFTGLSLLRGQPNRALGLACAGALVIWAGTFGWTLPRLHGLWLTPRIVAAAEAAAACPDRVLATNPYHEPSLVFLHGPYRTRLAATPEEVAEVLSEHRDCIVAMVGARERERFLARAAELGIAPTPASSVQGRNYSNGRMLDLTLFVLAPG